MTVPTLSKTWQFNINQVLSFPASPLISFQKWYLALKNSLKGFALSPWVVKGSSNGVTGAMDGTDRWTTIADIVWAAGSHSWVVLEQAGLSAHFQICLDMNSSNAGYTSLIISPVAGFTGGSVSARPTATDEHVLINANITVGPRYSSTTPFQSVLNVMQSTDGQCTRIFTFNDNQLYQFAFFEKLASPVTGFTNPNVWYWAGNSANCALYTNMHTSTVYFRHGSANYGGGITQEWGFGGYLTAQFSGIPNEISNEWHMSPAGFLCNTSPVRGRHGRLFDFWYGSTGHPDGTCYPGDGTRTFAQIGNQIILPWNGQPPLIS